MTTMLPVENKPFIVVEGIYNPDRELDMASELKDDKIILYTGTLMKRYGVLNLVNAFLKIKSKSVSLIVCGEGDAKNEILKLSQRDSRIIYKGLMAHGEVLSLQKRATLLVNPRTPEGIYTKYSFPSKIMEYFASGSPTLMYKLPGIPEEYYDFCYSIEMLGEGALASKIDELLGLPPEELKQKGLSAREFVLSQKNPEVQCAKIIEMLKKI
jgi:glycosyltransferase involved in cell wall biosynthesis